MNYHIMIQEKFLDAFIEDVYALGEESNNIFLFRGKKNETSNIKTERPVEYIGSDSTCIKSRLSGINANDHIFVHWYDTFISEILFSLPNKIFVILWGGEFYSEPIEYHASWLYDEKTFFYAKKLYYPRIILRKNVFKIFKSIWDVCYFPKEIEKAYKKKDLLVSRIDYIIVPDKSIKQVEKVKQLYSSFKAQQLSAAYEANYDFTCSLPPKTKSSGRIKVLVGNSAYPANNHFDAFDKLRDIKGIEVYCPLSYGEDRLKEEIIDYGNLIFENDFHPLLDFMERKKYLDLLNSMDILYMYHNRQQGWGNIAAALALGKPVFLKGQNTLTDLIDIMNINCYDAEKINDYNLSEIIAIERKNRNENLKKLHDIISTEKRLNEWKSILTGSF